jgi:exodeoxyribonuclease V gamma subunit
VLHIHRAERADRLADELAEILAGPPADPFTPEVIAVPTRGMERWLTQRLSARLGATAGRRDGICANVDFPFPGRLIGGVIATASGIDPDDDPWPPERSVWPLLDVVDRCLGEPWLAQLASHFEGTAGEGAERRFGRLRVIADLYDQYGIRRPAMLQAWADGRDAYGSGDPLAPGAVWQAMLWRELRAEIGIRSPAERLVDACARLHEDPGMVELPERISLFGLTRLPASYLAALAALAAGRDVHLLLLHPSPALWQAVADRDPAGPILTRATDPTEAVAENRLLASWGVDARELQLVVESAGDHDDRHHQLPSTETTTLLAQLQADVRANRTPPGPPLPGVTDERLALTPEDRSVEIHSCHGPARQVEVLREVILHLLADDPTLEPRDVIVMCPDIETFAPLIQASFGTIEMPDGDDDLSIPADDIRRVDLRVRLADRSLRQTNPVLGVVAQLLDLAQQRLTASQMLDLAGSEPVRRRFRFDDEEIARTRDWIVDSGIRWGIDASHRAEYKLDKVENGTWLTGLRRVLLGVAMAESQGELYAQVLPVDDVESGAIDLAGRFAEFVDRVRTTLDALRGPNTVEGWTAAIGNAADALTTTSDRDSWQTNELRGMLAEIVAESGESAARIAIGLAEARALLRHRLAGRPTRANFRTGHLTVCTLVPMRSVPHRVVCLLGLDDGAFPRKSPRDGDDLLLESPHVGDRDPRAEDRQMLLDALLAAEDRLVVLYSGNDERTNARLPPAVPVGELLDTVDRTARTQDGPASDRIVVRHPLQPFDQRNFAPGAIAGDDAWSFDRTSLEGALALSDARSEPAPFLSAPLPALPTTRVTLEALVAFAERPVRAFMRQRLGIAGAGFDDEVSDALPVELDGLERWQIGQRLLDSVLAGIAPDTACRAEIARGGLPPGQLGMPVIRRVWPDVELLTACARSVSSEQDPRSVGINAALADGTLITGSVSGVRDNTLLTVSFSRLNARHRIAAWVRLLALTAAHPQEPFEAVTIGKAPYRSDHDVAIARIPPLGAETESRAGRAFAELAMLIDLRTRGLRDVLAVPPLTAAAYAAAAARGFGSETDARDAWASSWNVDGEDVDPDHVLAFGGVRPFEWLLETIPASDEQGDGWFDDTEPSRFGRCARRLWSGLLAVENVELR